MLVLENQENGLLVPVGDVKALAQAMEEFYQLNDAVKIEMGKKGRAKATREFADTKISLELMSIIQGVLSDQN